MPVNTSPTPLAQNWPFQYLWKTQKAQKAQFHTSDWVHSQAAKHRRGKENVWNLFFQLCGKNYFKNSQALFLSNTNACVPLILQFHFSPPAHTRPETKDQFLWVKAFIEVIWLHTLLLYFIYSPCKWVCTSLVHMCHAVVLPPRKILITHLPAGKYTHLHCEKLWVHKYTILMVLNTASATLFV